MEQNFPRIFHHEKFESTSSGTDLLNILSEQEIPMHRLQKAYKRNLARDARHEEENLLLNFLEGEMLISKHSNFAMCQLEPNTTYLLENVLEKWVPSKNLGKNSPKNFHNQRQ